MIFEDMYGYLVAVSPYDIKYLKWFSGMLYLTLKEDNPETFCAHMSEENAKELMKRFINNEM